MADLRGIHRRLFTVFTVLACLAAALLGVAGPGQVTAAVLVFVIAHGAFNWALSLYDSFLPAVAGSRRIGFVSGLGWALGYLGGPLCLLVVLLLGAHIDQPTSLSFRLIFGVVGAYYLIFAIPALKLLPRSVTRRGPDVLHAMRISSLARVWTTLRSGKEHKGVFLYLLAVYLITDGIITIVHFTGLYGRETLGLEVAEIGVAMVLTQLVGIPACIAAGVLADRWGHRRVLMTCVCLWIAVVLALSVIDSRTEFFALAAGTGLVIGSTQAVSRSLLAKLVPIERSAEMFGFYAVSNKVSSTVGPILFGVIAVACDSQRAAVLSLIPFFAVGLVLLRWVPETRDGAVSRT